jgi:ribosomal protein L16 Arg81 hydroxylase
VDPPRRYTDVLHLKPLVTPPVRTAAAASLTSLLAPLSTDVFFRDYWEQRHCVIARDSAAFYGGLLTRRDLDALLHHYRQPGAMSTGARVTLVKNSENNAVRQPTPTSQLGQLDINGLYDWYRRGYTLIIDMAQMHWPAIAALCQSLETELHFGVQANIYVTPRGAQGFAPHFDTHDVFILQVAGSKVWRIFAGGDTLPMSDSRAELHGSLGPATDEFTLRQGDLLYIPRGLVHEAATTDDSSIHITLGLHVWRWADLLREAIMALAESDVRLRTSLPVGLFASDRTDGEQLQTQARELLRGCADTIDVGRVLQRMGERIVQRREPVPDGHFESLDRLDTIAGDTWLHRRTGMLCGVSVENGKATIMFPGGVVSGPPTLERALRFVAATEAFQVRDLPGPEWAPLSAKAQAVLARRLVTNGLLSVGSAPEPADI